MIFNKLCMYTRRHVFSYLSSHDYVTLRTLRKMSSTETKDISASISSFSITDIDTLYLFRKMVIPYFLTRLAINCHNHLIVENPIVFSNLRYLDFFLDYNALCTSFQWSHFFNNIQTPALQHVSWNHVDVDFVEIERIFKQLDLNRHLKSVHVKRPLLSTLTSLVSSSDPDPRAKQLVAFHRSCPNLETMRLDDEAKYVDSLYISMFQTPQDFSCLRSLQLINRSMSLTNHVCRNRHLLPNLENLEIMWLFDSENVYQPSSPSTFFLQICKPQLQNLKLCYMSWGKIFQDSICSIRLCSTNCVQISTKNVNLVVMDCPNGYMES